MVGPEHTVKQVFETAHMIEASTPENAVSCFMQDTATPLRIHSTFDAAPTRHGALVRGDVRFRPLADPDGAAQDSDDGLTDSVEVSEPETALPNSEDAMSSGSSIEEDHEPFASLQTTPSRRITRISVRGTPQGTQPMLSRVLSDMATRWNLIGMRFRSSTVWRMSSTGMK